MLQRWSLTGVKVDLPVIQLIARVRKSSVRNAGGGLQHKMDQMASKVVERVYRELGPLLKLQVPR